MTGVGGAEGGGGGGIEPTGDGADAACLAGIGDGDMTDEMSMYW